MCWLHGSRRTLRNTSENRLDNEMASLLIVATGNQHKVDEIGAILPPSITCVPMRVLGTCPELVEDGDTFEANAEKKVRQLAEWMKTKPPLRFPIDRFENIQLLADDSGLAVDALDGAPGVHSARFASESSDGGNAPDQANNAKLLSLLSDTATEQRTARFCCVLALLRNPFEQDCETEFFTGHCEGHIATERYGSEGFGYDPLFFPSGQTRSFGQLGADLKNKISHRAKALESLAAHLNTKAN